MSGSISMDMADRLIKTADDPDIHNQVQILGAIFGIAKLHSSIRESLQDPLPARKPRMHQQRFRGITYSGVLRLRIDGNARRLVDVGKLVNVYVAHAVGMAEHRNPRAVLNASNHLIRRSEEHTSELQSRENLVCRLLL